MMNISRRFLLVNCKFLQSNRRSAALADLREHHGVKLPSSIGSKAVFGRPWNTQPARIHSRTVHFSLGCLLLVGKDCLGK